MTLGAIALLWTVPVLQFALVLVFWNRRIFLTKFPAFFEYTCFSVAANVLLIAVNHHPVVYFWVYWIGQVIYGVLAVLVMREIFQAIWNLNQGLRRFLVWTLILMLGGMAVWVGYRYPQGTDPLAGVEAACYAFMTGVQLVEVVLCGLVIRLVRRFTQYHLGIMLGFGVSAIAQILAYVGHFYRFGPVFREVVVYAPLSVYIGACGTWLFVFLSKPKMTTKLDPDTILKWLDEQEKMARQVSSDLGLKWPDKKKKSSDQECAANA